MAADAIEATGLQKSYGGLFGRSSQVALHGLDLRVPAGSAFGLIGPNGAGKTTFIKLLLGIVRPSAGQARVLGGDPDDPEVRRRIGYLPERLHLSSSWSSIAFLSSVARLKGLRDFESEITRLIERVGLTESAHRKIGGFSKGMKQRLGLAAALIGRPELLVLDEPTDGIDPLGRVEIRGILAEELQRGVTLFLNSHLLSETERICSRVGILARGRLVREGPLDELCRPSNGWRARFAAGANVEAIRAAGFAAIDERSWRIEVADAPSLNAAIDRARAAGAMLVELSQESHDLESVLADAVRQAA